MMNKQQLIDFFQAEFAEADFEIIQLGKRTASIRQPIAKRHLRPGGTVSGPTLMTLADAALYATILSELGPVALAVTTNLNVTFMHKPSSEHAIIAECKLLKLGRSMAVGEVTLYSEGNESPVAHAVGTYAIPAVSS